MVRFRLPIYILAIGVVWFGLAAGSGQAQQGPQWRYWLASDGLYESTSPHVTVGPDGSVWINHGHVEWMTRLDGYGVSHIPSPGSALPIEISKNGDLWSCDAQGFLRYERGTDTEVGQWIHEPIKGFLGNALPFLAVDSETVLYLLPDGVHLYNAKTKRTELLWDVSQSPLGQLNDFCWSARGGLWLAGERGAGILTSPHENFSPPLTFTAYCFPPELNLDQFDEVMETCLGTVVGSALNRQGEREMILVELRNGQWRIVHRTSPGKRFGGWTSDGLYWLYDRNRVVTVHRGQEQPVEKSRVLSRVIFETAMDRDGGLWIATSQGLARYAPAIWQTPDAMAYRHQVVHDIREDRAGNVWFTYPDALVVLQGDRWKAYPLPSGLVTQELVQQGSGLLPDGRLAIESSAEGLLTFDPQRERYQTIDHPDGLQIGLLANNGNDGLWTVAYNDAEVRIERFDGSRFHPVVQVSSRNTLNPHARCMYVEPSGAVWLGGLGGLMRYEKGETRVFGKEDGFIETAVNCIEPFDDGRIWIGGRDALLEYDGNHWKTIRTGLDGVRTIFQARDGVVWVAAGTGLHRYENGSWIVNTAQDGLPDAAVFDVFQDSQNRLWAGTTDGLSRYVSDADRYPPRTFLPKENNQVEAALGEARFVFSGIDRWNHTLSARLLFSYCIDGGTWSPFDAATLIPVPDLAAGKHTFSVRAMDRTGNIDPYPPLIECVILLPWFRQPAFLLLFGIGSVTIVSLLVLHGIHHRHVERTVKERTSDLQAAYDRLVAYRDELRSMAADLAGTEERERRSIATDLHDGIGQTLALIAIQLQSLQASLNSGAALEKIQGIEELVERTLQQSRTLMFQICPPILYELGLEAAIDRLAEELRREHGLEVEIRNDGTDKPLRDDYRYFLYRAIRELLINVMKHAASRKALVSLSREDLNLSIEVEDEGTGFDAAKAEVRNREGGSFGLFSIRERLARLGGELRVKTEPGSGTTITIVVPLDVREDNTGGIT